MQVRHHQQPAPQQKIDDFFIVDVSVSYLHTTRRHLRPNRRHVSWSSYHQTRSRGDAAARHLMCVEQALKTLVGLQTAEKERPRLILDRTLALQPTISGEQSSGAGTATVQTSPDEMGSLSGSGVHDTLRNAPEYDTRNEGSSCSIRAVTFHNESRCVDAVLDRVWCVPPRCFVHSMPSREERSRRVAP
jgi:hypothetical protein